MTLKEAYHRLVEEVRSDKNVVSIGLAEKGEFNPQDFMVLYLKQRVRHPYPKTYEEFPVETRIIGTIALN